MNVDHPRLGDIRAGVVATGWHYASWGDLRREVFPGEEAWPQLKQWCAENAMECMLEYVQSSKSTEVQFRRLRKNAALDRTDGTETPANAALETTLEPPVSPASPSA
jgi:hypothetical protein